MIAEKLQVPKGKLEAFYAQRNEDKKIEEDSTLKSEYETLLNEADGAINEFTNAIKPIRGAVDS